MSRDAANQAGLRLLPYRLHALAQPRPADEADGLNVPFARAGLWVTGDGRRWAFRARPASAQPLRSA